MRILNLSRGGRLCPRIHLVREARTGVRSQRNRSEPAHLWNLGPVGRVETHPRYFALSSKGFPGAFGLLDDAPLFGPVAEATRSPRRTRSPAASTSCRAIWAPRLPECPSR